jgi:hypothetical protein
VQEERLAALNLAKLVSEALDLKVGQSIEQVK